MNYFSRLESNTFILKRVKLDLELLRQQSSTPKLTDKK